MRISIPEINSKCPVAVIVGFEKNGLGVARSLSRERIPCVALATPSWNPACETNTCTVVHSSSWTMESVIDDLISIGKMLKFKAPLLITKDEPVLWISSCREELSEYYEINLPADDVTNLLMNKHLFLKKSLEMKWPVPVSWCIRNKDELMSFLPEITYPCVLKPAVKNSTYRKKSRYKVYRANCAAELEAAYNMVQEWEKEAVVQEWLDGGDDRLAFCLTYYNRENQPLSLFAGRKIRQWPVTFGTLTAAEPAPGAWVQSIFDLSETVFKETGFTGLGSLEIKMRKDDDQPVIMEPTVGRTDYQNELAVLNGQNIPVIAYYDLIGEDRFPAFSSLNSWKLIDGSRDIKAVWFNLRRNKLTIIQFLKEQVGKKKYMLIRSGDLRPFIASILFFLNRVVRKITKAVKTVIFRRISFKMTVK